MTPPPPAVATFRLSLKLEVGKRYLDTKIRVISGVLFLYTRSLQAMVELQLRSLLPILAIT